MEEFYSGENMPTNTSTLAQNLFNNLYLQFLLPEKSDFSWTMATKIAFDNSPNIPITNRADITHAYDEAISFLKPLIAESTKIEIGDIVGTIVCDRHEWIVNTIESISSLFSETFNTYKDLLENKTSSKISKKASSAFIVTELGFLIGFVSRKVLGQYDAGTQTKKADSLLIVESNIIEREMQLNLSDLPFRLWILTHELTHRIQFIRFPWLRDYYFSLINEAGNYINNIISNNSKTTSIAATFSIVTDKDGKLLMQKIQAMMSFIEGHADFIMFSVGKNLPKYDQLESVFSKDKQNNSFIKNVIEKILGLEMKRNQYRQGLLFFDKINKLKSIDFLNNRLDSSSKLPTMAEIDNPILWLNRIS